MAIPESISVGRPRGLRVFFLIIAVLALTNVALALMPVPRGALLPLGLFVAAAFLALPIYALFRGGDYDWTPKLAGAFIASGLFVHVGLALCLSQKLFPGVAGGIAGALSQMGLMVWCIGLGALLATSAIKEPNLLLPVSVFLIAFDILLVMTPVGTVSQVLAKAPHVFERVAYVVPKVSESATYGPVGAAAYIGPADFIFLAMFFVCLYKFKMNARLTMMVLIPVLLAYMVAVHLFGPLPALPPIAICVLVANAKYFKLAKDEWLATIMVAVIMSLLVGYFISRPKPQPAPSPAESFSSAPEPAEKQGRATPNPPRG